MVRAKRASLRWFTANIGIHHVHHLRSRVPYYRLPHVLRDHPELRDVGHITLLQSFRCVRLVLWDEAQRRLVSFRELRTRGLQEECLISPHRLKPAVDAEPFGAAVFPNIACTKL